MVKIGIGNYGDETFERVRFVAPLSNGQFYIMEAENIDDWDGDTDGVIHITWNIFQCVVDKVEDRLIYSVDESVITGKVPMETYHAARQGLREIEEFLSTQYSGYDYLDVIIHHLEAGWTDERRRGAYSKVLTKLGWHLDDYELYYIHIIEEKLR